MPRARALSPQSKCENDEDASQTSCGLPDEVDPNADEWAARLVAQREGATSGGAADAPGVPAGAPACGVCGVCGGGAKPSFVPELPAAREEGFAGFDGFEGEQGGNANTAEGFGPPVCALPPPAPSQAAAAFTTPQPLQRQADWSTNFDVGALENVRPSRLSQPLATPRAGSGDGHAVRALTGVRHAQVSSPRASSSRDEDEDDFNWAGILGAPAAATPASEPTSPPISPLEEFTVFDGFGRDNKPVKSKAAGTARDAGRGMTWDEERKVWEEQSRSSYGRVLRGVQDAASPYDLRQLSTFKSPASLQRFRKHAEKVFDDAVSNSIFTSPAVVRFKKQTDELFEGVGRSLEQVFSWNPFKAIGWW